MSDRNGLADERAAAALARLTANEKECLRRRLLPQTAKEMAIDLGVSPHAVEKRPKMARAKLGVSSSLAAARLLAAANGYAGPVPRPADLPDAAPGAQEDGVASRVPRRRFVSPTLFVAGAFVMFLLAGFFVLSPQSVQPAVSEAAAVQTTIYDEKGRPVSARKTDINEAAAFNGQHFDRLDTDHSGSLDPREASAMEPRDDFRDKSLPLAPPAGQPDAAAERKWMAKLDDDRDGRVSRAEYISYMLPWTLLSGVPTAWRGANADAEARAKSAIARH